MEYEDIVSLVAVVLLCLYLVLKCLSSRCGESGDPQADETPNSTSSAADGGRTTTPASHGDMISMNRGGGGRRTTPAASLHSTADRGNGAGRTTSMTTTTTTSHGDHDIDNEGLDRGVLARMPTFDIDEETKQRDACSVCLMEMEEGEKARLLLPCFHCFHVDCIDMWLHSHTTCPLCRSLVGYLDV